MVGKPTIEGWLRARFSNSFGCLMLLEQGLLGFWQWVVHWLILLVNWKSRERTIRLWCLMKLIESSFHSESFVSISLTDSWEGRSSLAPFPKLRTPTVRHMRVLLRSLLDKVAPEIGNSKSWTELRPPDLASADVHRRNLIRQQVVVIWILFFTFT